MTAATMTRHASRIAACRATERELLADLQALVARIEAETNSVRRERLERQSVELEHIFGRVVEKRQGLERAASA